MRKGDMPLRSAEGSDVAAYRRSPQQSERNEGVRYVTAPLERHRTMRRKGASNGPDWFLRMSRVVRDL